MCSHLIWHFYLTFYTKMWCWRRRKTARERSGRVHSANSMTRVFISPGEICRKTDWSWWRPPRASATRCCSWTFSAGFPTADSGQNRTGTHLIRKWHNNTINTNVKEKATFKLIGNMSTSNKPTGEIVLLPDILFNPFSIVSPKTKTVLTHKVASYFFSLPEQIFTVPLVLI